MKAPEEAYLDVAGIVTGDMDADHEGRLLGERDVSQIRATLVNVTPGIDQEVIANVSPAVALLMQALYAFDLHLAVGEIRGREPCGVMQGRER